MDELFTIYEVRSDDTLAKIGQKIGMTADEVRDFHNENCERNGLMWFNNLVGIEKIVLPKNFKSAAQIRKENLEAVPPKTLSTAFYAEKYQVAETYESDFENTIEITYTVNIKLEEKKEERGKIFVASVTCSDFLNNGEKPDDKMSELSIACAESIAPLQFDISSQVTLFKVYQIEKLQKVFEAKRKELEEFFIGEVAQKYMDRFAKNLGDKNYFEKQIRSTLLYQVLFPSRSWFYKESDWKEEFYFVKNSFPINCIFSIAFDHLNENEIQMSMRGEIDDKFTLQQVLRGKKLNEEPEEAVVGLVELKYITDKSSKELQSVESGIALLHEGDIYRKQKLTLSKI